MARKKTKRFADGGDIVVRGTRDNRLDFDTLDQLMRGGGLGGYSASGGFGSMGGGYGGGAASSVRPTQVEVPKSSVKFGKIPTPAGNVYGATVPLSDRASLGLGLGRGVIGKQGQPLVGASFRTGFKKGGKIESEPTGGKSRNKAKRYVKGGSVSSASKRADGCATKGKTKGRFV